MQLMVNSERVYIVIKSAFAGSLYLVLAFLVAADLQFVRFHALLLQDFRAAVSPSRYSEMAFFSSTKFQKKKRSVGAQGAQSLLAPKHAVWRACAGGWRTQFQPTATTDH